MGVGCEIRDRDRSRTFRRDGNDEHADHGLPTSGSQNGMVHPARGRGPTGASRGWEWLPARRRRCPARRSRSHLPSGCRGRLVNEFLMSGEIRTLLQNTPARRMGTGTRRIKQRDRGEQVAGDAGPILSVRPAPACPRCRSARLASGGAGPYFSSAFPPPGAPRSTCRRASKAWLAIPTGSSASWAAGG